MPLPTKPVFKPSSGTVPPPSVVNALSKKLGQVVPFPDLRCKLPAGA